MHNVLLAVIIAFGGLQNPSGQAVLTGRLLAEGTSSPIESAQVSLTRFSADLPLTEATRNSVGNVAFSLQNPRLQSPDLLRGLVGTTARLLGVSEELLKPVYTASTTTDPSGSFRFADLAPGRYVLAITREGYFADRTQARNTTMIRIITIEPVTQPSPLDLFMVEGGSISGRIRNPLGEPAANLIVSGYRPRYRDGVLSWESVRGGLTDDRGEFRLSPLLPGQYLIAVAPPPPASNLKWEETWVRTFYPGSDFPLAAVPVSVNLGQEVRAINIDIVKVDPIRTYTISGTALNPLPSSRPAPATGVVDRGVESFYLIPREPSLIFDPYPSNGVLNAIPAGSRPNGEFAIHNVKPGTYDLYAEIKDSTGRSLIGRTTVDVRDQDVSGLSIAIRGGGTLETQVVFEGPGDPALRLDSLQLEIRKTGTMPISIPSGQAFDAAGRIVLQNFPESQYRFSLRGLPANAYVADIQQFGRSVYDEDIVTGPQLESVRIIARTDGGTVTGSVERSGRGIPQGTVILIPPAMRRRNPQLFRTATTDAEGRFSISGIMPGLYTILALDSLPPGEPWLNETFLNPLLQRAQDLRIDPFSTAGVRLEPLAD